MAPNKKQKKQIDASRKKLLKVRQLLTAAKAQPDDPTEATQLQAEIATIEAQIKKLQEDS